MEGLPGWPRRTSSTSAATTSPCSKRQPEPGGKLRRAAVGGVVVDVGAEAMLNRRPEGVDLARELGLEVVHPAVQSSRIWTRGALRPLPAR